MKSLTKNMVIQQLESLDELGELLLTDIIGIRYVSGGKYEEYFGICKIAGGALVWVVTLHPLNPKDIRTYTSLIRNARIEDSKLVLIADKTQIQDFKSGGKYEELRKDLQDAGLIGE